MVASLSSFGNGLGTWTNLPKRESTSHNNEENRHHISRIVYSISITVEGIPFS